MSTQTQTRDSFIFYRSFYDASKCLKTNEKAQLFDAICSYALDEKIEQLDGTAFGMFQLVKPQLDANRKRFQNGCVKKQNESKTEAKKKQNESKTEANVNVNVNKNVNEECKSELINHNQNINIDFQEFWDHYTPIECNGRMVSKDSKKLAEEKYNKLRSKYSHNLIMSKLEKYLTNCKKNSILTKAVHRWLTTTDFNDNEECTSIVANTIMTKQDLQKNQDAEVYKRFLERTNDPNYINYFK